MTKVEAVREFKEHVLPHIKAKYETDGRPRYVARRTAWNDFTDYLAKDGRITEWQDYNWVQPRCVRRRGTID